MISNRTAQRDCSPSVGHVTGGETVLVTLPVGHVTSGGETRSWSLWSLSLCCSVGHVTEGETVLVALVSLPV